MSEFRQNPTTGSIVIIAPGRSSRPGSSHSPPKAEQPLARLDGGCPFCPGNESQLLGIVAETAADDAPGWSTRVVPNKYPAVEADAAAEPHDLAHETLAGKGFHEVIIESPFHDADLPVMDTTQITQVIATYHQRFCELSQRPGIAAVVLFRNHGTRSGASLVHPHAQIIALPLVPPRMQAIDLWAAQQGMETGQCPMCAELAREQQSGKRLVEESAEFVALVPFAAEVPCEVWIVPQRHAASFADSRPEELADLGGLLRRTLQRLKAAHGDPPYSFAIESAGVGADAAHLHWRLRIVPDLINAGGFERGAGIPINPSAPEADAELLRKALD